MASRAELLEWGRVAGLVGGVLVLVGALVNALLFVAMGAFLFGFPGRFVFALAAVLGVVGVGAGVVALASARRVPTAPDPKRPGMTLVVAGAVAFVAGGGFFFGSVAMVGAGVLAVMAAGRPPGSAP